MSAPYHNKALREGAVLREWRLENVLGVGGFGIVYRGRGLYFDEVVAIKEYFPGAISDRVDETTVAPNDSSSEEVYNLGLSKFLEEAKILWNLSKPDRHPNIVAVRSLFQINGTAYMVMDYESGVSLSQMLKDGREFNEADLLAIVKPIGHGLDRAHRAGVLHRDIKPANILVDPVGRPVLIDFGSARFDSGQATSTKVTFYTPPYAAIEQYVKTYPQGPWTDIYALGVTLYECVAGKKPPEVLERLHGGLDEPLSEQARPGFSPAFIRAVEAAMAIKPADRPQSIEQWLRMFDAQAPVNEEATRIAVLRDNLEPPRVVEKPPEPKKKKADAPPPVAAKPAKPAKRAKPVPAPLPPPAAADPGASADEPETGDDKAKPKSRMLLLGGAAAAVVLGGLGALFLRPHEPQQVVPGAPASAGGLIPGLPGLPGAGEAPAGNAAAVAAAPSGVVQALDALVAEVRQAGRPSREVAALNAAADKISTLASATPPDPAAIDQIAFQAAKSQGSALARDAASQTRDLQSNAAWQGARAKGPRAKLGTIQAARQAKAGLDASVAAIGRSADSTSAVQAARRALADHLAFVSALAAAQPAFVSARAEQVITLEATARQAAAEVVKLAANVRKPGMFASGSSKRSYKVAQDAAARAQTRLAELERQAQAARSATDMAVVNGTIETLSAGIRELEALKASTAAALQSDGAASTAPSTP